MHYFIAKLIYIFILRAQKRSEASKFRLAGTKFSTAVSFSRSAAAARPAARGALLLSFKLLTPQR
jgi:hypothetical protein